MNKRQQKKADELDRLAAFLNLTNAFNRVHDGKISEASLDAAHRRVIEEAAEFVYLYGALRSRSRPSDEAGTALAAAECMEYAKRLRRAYTAKDVFDVRSANRALDEIFRALDPATGDPIPQEQPVLRADLIRGCIVCEPRTLLQELALTLLTRRKSLIKCRQCGRFFVRRGRSNRQYCLKTTNRDCFREHRKSYNATKTAEWRTRSQAVHA